MKKVLVLVFIAAVGFGFVFGDVSSIYAQEEFTLEEITVTAQKREENQQKVPIVMQVVSGEDMQELGYNNLDEIISTLAGAYVNTAGDGFRVSIRGISDDIRATGPYNDYTVSTPSVAVNVDGVYTQGRTSGAGLYDMERVEVLYGPQSTLYSSASPGGIVNIVTADPKTDKYEASGSLEYGNYNTLQLQGVMNAPLSDSVALRAAFSTSVHDGYMSNGSMDEDIKSARLKTLFKPNDALSLVVTGELTKTGGIGASMIDGFVSQDDLGDPWANSDDDPSPPRDLDRRKITAHFDWDLGFGTITLLPSYNTEDSHDAQSMEDNSGNQYTRYMDRTGTEKGVELRVASSSDSSIQWILGGNYYRMNTRQNLTSVPLFGQPTDRRVAETTDAVYGNVTYPVTDTFRVTGGLRYTKDVNDLIEIQYRIEEGLGRTDYQHCNIPYKDFDYKIGFEMDLGTDSMIYVDWSSSYRPVGMSIKPTLKPETLDAYTLGMKNRFLGNKLQVNVATYFYDYKNYVASFGMVADPANFNRTDPGADTNGDLEYAGVDLQTSAILGSNDKLDFSVSYLQSQFTRLIFDFDNPLFPDLDYSGKPETFTPEWTFDVNYSHNFDLTNGGVLTARIDSRYQTDYLVNVIDLYQRTEGMELGPMNAVFYYEFLSQAPWVTQEAHHISNASIIYTHPDGKLTLTGYIKNIENYAEKKHMMMSFTMIGAPRTYGAVLTVRY